MEKNGTIKVKIKNYIESCPLPTLSKSTSNLLGRLNSWAIEETRKRSESPSYSDSSFSTYIEHSPQSSPQHSPPSSPYYSPQNSPNRRSPRMIQLHEERPHLTLMEWKSITDLNGPIQLPISGIQRLYEVFCFHHTDGYLTQKNFYDLLALANPAFGHSKTSRFYNRLFDLFRDKNVQKGLTCVEWILAVSILCDKTSLMTSADIMMYTFGSDRFNTITLDQIEQILVDFDPTPTDMDRVMYKTCPTKGKAFYYTSFLWQQSWKKLAPLSYEQCIDYIKHYPFLLSPIALDWAVVDLSLPIESP